MGAASSRPDSSDEKVFQTETPISFSPDVVNQLADRLEATETTPERQSLLDAHIRSRIRDEIQHLKRDEEEVRQEIERALEKENLDQERSMAGTASESDGSGAGDVRSSASLLGDMEEIKAKIEKHQNRRSSVEVSQVDTHAAAVANCYKNNVSTPLNCWTEVNRFKTAVGQLEQEQFKSL